MHGPPQRVKPTKEEVAEKFKLITRNLQEVLRPEVITEILERGDDVKVYWGALLCACHAQAARGCAGRFLQGPRAIPSSTALLVPRRPLEQLLCAADPPAQTHPPPAKAARWLR